MQTALPFPPALAVRNVRSHTSLGRANERILILRNTGCTERVTLESGQCCPRFLGQGIICCVWKCFDLKSRIVLILGHMQCIAQKLSLLVPISPSCYYKIFFAENINSLHAKVWAYVHNVCNHVVRATPATAPAWCQKKWCPLFHILHDVLPLIGLSTRRHFKLFRFIIHTLNDMFIFLIYNHQYQSRETFDI